MRPLCCGLIVWGAAVSIAAESMPAPATLSLQGSAKLGAALDEAGVPQAGTSPGWQFGLAVQWSLQVTWGSRGAPTVKSSTPSNDFTGDEQRLIDLTNAERQKVSAGTVRSDPVLMRVAREQSAHMARLKQLSHELEGRTFSIRMKDAKFVAQAAGEICAEGAKDPAEAIADWLQSPGHKQNLLEPKYTLIGVGIATDEDGRRYYTEVFARPILRARKSARSETIERDGVVVEQLALELR